MLLLLLTPLTPNSCLDMFIKIGTCNTNLNLRLGCTYSRHNASQRVGGRTQQHPPAVDYNCVVRTDTALTIGTGAQWLSIGQADSATAGHYSLFTRRVAIRRLDYFRSCRSSRCHVVFWYWWRCRSRPVRHYPCFPALPTMRHNKKSLSLRAVDVHVPGVPVYRNALQFVPATSPTQARQHNNQITLLT